MSSESRFKNGGSGGARTHTLAIMSRQHSLYATDPGWWWLLFGFTANRAGVSWFVRVSGFQLLSVDTHVFTVLLVLKLTLATTVLDVLVHCKILGLLNWCARWDSNPHAFRHWYLKPAWLPFHHMRVTGGCGSTRTSSCFWHRIYSPAGKPIFLRIQNFLGSSLYLKSGRTMNPYLQN